MWNGKVGEVEVTEHCITLSDGSKPFNFQPLTRQVQQESVEDMSNSGVIVRSQSERATLVVRVRKPDWTLTFCIDYQIINAMTFRDTYTVPRVDECLDSLEDARAY